MLKKFFSISMFPEAIKEDSDLVLHYSWLQLQDKFPTAEFKM